MTSLIIYTFLISILTLTLVIWTSHKYQWFIDHHYTNKPQNFHTESTPRAGGIGILLGMFFLLFIPLGLKFLLSIILAFLSGIFEDFNNSLSPKQRLFLQFIAASTAVWLSSAVVTYLGLGISLPYWAGTLFSIFAIVGMMNAVNIIDGFNGLASGVILLILISFAIISHQEHNAEILQIINITAGATFGFFILNFPKGKIFLGDGGAYMLGFIVAIIGIFLASRYINVSPWYILSIFIYPVWEVIFSIVRKKSMGRSPMQPDQYHLHMLLYRNITHNNPLTSLLILILLVPSMLLSTLYAHNSMMNIFIIIGFIFIYTTFYRYLYKQDQKNN